MIPSVVWVPVENRYTQILAGRNWDNLYEAERISVRHQLKTGWGLQASGYARLGSELVPIPSIVEHQALGLSTAWGRYETHTMTEDGAAGSARAVHNYSVHVHQPLPATNPAAATISLVVVRKNIQRRAPGNFSPLYDPARGTTTNQPNWYTRSGEVLWSTTTSTENEFGQALAYVDEWLRNREACDSLAALTPQFPNQ